ncbi:hypothetical protein [Williamsia phyllosphaerae]|uniref:Uncharacterized protein n=1 Tax=Williamsia phyllosphaerae TaxID=885042 RepID=A0ABQ1UVX2_9NOCA|nr:hypothetical protein [Williamsia phyllosphaerae]GGF26417.1 hypothetical protein GCM10007298_22910 [Williamsia phyllosphaerae]
MRVTRKKEQDRPLAEFPGWGLEIMMGLYGEEQVKTALSSESATPERHRPPTQAPHVDVDPASSEAAEFDAVSSVFARVRRMRRRR